MPRTLTGSVPYLEVAKPLTLHGEELAPGTRLYSDSEQLQGARVSSLISRGFLKVPGQLPLRQNKDFRAFHLTPGDWRSMETTPEEPVE